MENEIQTEVQVETQAETQTEIQAETQTEIQAEDQIEVKTTKCLNCGTEFEGNFCPECGQDAKTSRFTLRFIWSNLLSAVLGRDGGIGYTIKNLFSRPGKMIVEILEGKRRKYVSPFPTLFLALTLYVLIFTATGTKNIEIDNLPEDIDTELTVKVGEKTTEINNNSTAAKQMLQKGAQLAVDGYHFYLNHYTLCYMLTLPLFVVAARKCYGKENRKRYNHAEYIVAIVYAMVILVLYRCVVNLIYPISPHFYGKMTFYEPIAIIIALTACFRKMMGFSTIKTVWRSTLTIALYYLLLGAIVTICAVAIGFFFYFKYLR
jgi:hypothetical protein